MTCWRPVGASGLATRPSGRSRHAQSVAQHVGTARSCERSIQRWRHQVRNDVRRRDPRATNQSRICRSRCSLVVGSANRLAHDALLRLFSRLVLLRISGAAAEHTWYQPCQAIWIGMVVVAACGAVLVVVVPADNRRAGGTQRWLPVLARTLCQDGRWEEDGRDGLIPELVCSLQVDVAACLLDVGLDRVVRPQPHRVVAASRRERRAVR